MESLHVYGARALGWASGRARQLTQPVAPPQQSATDYNAMYYMLLSLREKLRVRSHAPCAIAVARPHQCAAQTHKPVAGDSWT